jgi:DNA-binding ferritin-like protein (Dps family)
MTEPEKKQALKAFFVLSVAMTVITLLYLILIYPYRFAISPASPLYMLKYLFSASVLVLILCYVCFYFIKTNKFEELLQDDFRNTLDEIMWKINESYLTKSQKNDIRRDLLDLLLTAQESGRCTKKVVGDTSKFANDIIESYGRYLWIYIGLIDGFLFTTLFILLDNFVLNVDRNFYFEKIFSHTTDISSLYMFVFFIFFAQYQRMGNRNKYSQILFMLIPLIVCFLPFIFPSLQQLYNSFFFREINLIPNIYVLLIYILIIPLTILFKKNLRRNQKVSNLLEGSR